MVLGDNNACYDRKLILWKLEEQETQVPASEQETEQEEKQTWQQEVLRPHGKIRCLGITLEGQYRPDLEENMTDQVNVALCGFWLKPDKIPAGVYRVGILADNRVSGIRLVNFSSTLYIQR